MLPSEHHYFTRYTPFAVMGVLALLGGVFFTVVNINQTQETRSRASSSNVLTNPGFESGKGSWYLWNRGSGSSSFSTTTSEKYGGAASGQVAVSSGGSVITDVELAQYGVVVSAGQTYTVTFAAKSSVNRTVDIVVQDSASPYKVYMRKTVSVSPTWQTYSSTFQATESKNDCLVGVQFGKASGTVWVDDVSMINGLPTQPTPTPTVYYAPTPTPTKVPTPTPFSAPTATPTSIPTPTKTPTPTVPNAPTPTKTPTPTLPGPTSAIPTPTKTPTPTAEPTDVPQPTNTPMPTPTLVPGSTNIAFNLALHGLGKGGDSANPNGTGNMTPLRSQRTVSVDVYNDSNVLVKTVTGTVAFDTTSGHFKGLISLGTDISSGAHQIRVKTDQFLRALVPGIQNLTAGQTKELPLAALVNGDINNDNQLNILDYNILMGCYSDLSPAVNCPAGEELRADITDDGAVNQFDYNLFLRELINRGGQ